MKNIIKILLIIILFVFIIGILISIFAISQCVIPLILLDLITE